jgi:hypothetical protein
MQVTSVSHEEYFTKVTARWREFTPEEIALLSV